MNNKKSFRKGDALLLVDTQNDFFPGGALPVPNAQTIIPIINQWLGIASKHSIPIIASRDWHPLHHCSFQQQQGPWPMHCVADSEGAQIHPAILLPHNVMLINKGVDLDIDAYSAFAGYSQDGATLDQCLLHQNITHLWIAGLAQDYCVLETALDAIKKGYAVTLIAQGTRSISSETGQNALHRMQHAGVKIYA